ncbi:hypothetical protein OEZ85_010143 [Tetradesmus obliquus]|uniref:Uncharacterized protein n=1 Tax=Tetradesmus obliquus TaxID=3088 RepID=A0ABY8TLR5_TETOB|nr:hypothetical protein OEZ85_010143 [Tetradesmus obliquus]
MGHPRWQLDPNSYELKPYDATAGQMGLTDPMALALNGLRGPGGLILQPGQQFPQGIMLGGEGGNMLPIIPMLPGMFPLMLNPAGQLQGMEGGMQADQLQAALAAMQQASGGLVAGSTPMMLTLPSGQEGDANAMSASQALQFAQLQGLTGNGQLPTLLQLTVQPDGGLVQANGQQLQLPGLGMPLQLPAIADALKAVAGGARAYNSAEEDAAAAALMSLATDKRKEAAQLLAQAQAATESGVIPEAAVNEMVAKAHRLQEEAEAEERAAAQAAEAEGRAHLEQQQAAQLEAQQQGLQQQLEALQQQQQLQQLQAAMAAQQQQQQEVKVEGADMGLQQAEQPEPKMEG